MQVRDIMIYNVYTILPSTTVKEVIELFEKHRIGGVPVVNDKGQLVGIVSDGDIVRFLSTDKQKSYVAYYLSLVQDDKKLNHTLREKMNTPVKEIMIKNNIETLGPDDWFEDALNSIAKHHFKKLPVVNGAGRVVGIISRGDIIHTLSKKLFQEDK